ncbi:MAG: DUF6011 domain-containing protein [Actinoallomurus sp.]
MTAVVSTRCHRCGAELRDRTSRVFGIGPECRKTMTDTQLRAAMNRNTPGHTPPAVVRPASPQARHNHAELERVTAPVVAEKRCTHDGIPAQCPLCRREADPWRCAQRIIATVQRLPMDQRIELQRAAARRLWAAYLPTPEPDQLTIGEPT